ncbi:hypothetical protein SUGI_1204070 [Cryptomeria japonica]|uniref:uncharacterized protein LOC131860416 n=1 Tax=Cryptomeria japonica TaxID=3369 RepID=UPI0024149622|nr:uncharacterized protein LOC131860416 [Cryptomeria japonica]GLJ56085.1 hypothetical protein SUGI_1204070 [Cryptomeria japonica]
MDFTEFDAWISRELRSFLGRCATRQGAFDFSTFMFWGLLSPLPAPYDLREPESSGVLRFCFLQSLLGIDGGIIDPPEYKHLFNSLITAMHSSFLSYSKEFKLNPGIPSSCSKILAQAQQKARILLGPSEMHGFMHHWASRFTTESLLFSGKHSSMLRVSYNSNIGGFLKITSYSPLVSMETTNGSSMVEERLHRALSYHLLHCIFQFGHVVNVYPHWIEVCLQIDNVRCDVCPLHRLMEITGSVLNERHFPSKICLTIGPKNGHGVHSVSLTRSSQNPITEIGKGNTYEATFEAPKNVGLKATTTTTSTVKINNWGFEQLVVNDSDAKIDWTLYDSTTAKAVFNNGPPKFSVLGPKTWSIDRYSKACRAFTQGGGVVFAKNDYGDPVTWRLNKDLEGQTLKWIVQGSVWLTYWPNTHRTRCSETKRHDFYQEFDLTLA